MAGPIISQSGL